LNDLAEWGARKLRLQFSDNRLVGAAWRKLLLQFFYLLLAALVSANLIWYFVEPQRFFASLFSGELRFGVALTFAATALLIYLDLALVRRLMCREFCPYGRIQATLVDPGTLTLQLPETEKPRCIKCNSCVRCCPMGIDIRNGYQVECINCGRCLDACRIIMNNRSEPGLICYTFGSNNLGPSALFNPRTLILGLLLLSLLTGLGFAVFNRAEASLKVSVSHKVASRILNDGQQVTFFNAWLNNRGTEEKSYSLLAKDAAGAPLTLKGQTAALTLSGGANRKIDYVLVTPPVDAPSVVEFLLTDEQRNVLARARAQILPITRN
jgi:cytochrome c oxidase accessory protein FixG